MVLEALTIKVFKEDEKAREEDKKRKWRGNRDDLKKYQ